MKNLCYFFLIFIIGLNLLAKASFANGSLEVIEIPKKSFSTITPDQSRYSTILKDSTFSLSLKDVLKLDSLGRFKVFDPKVYSGRISNKYAIWRHIKIKSPEPTIVFLEMGYAEFVTIYIRYADGTIQKKEGGNMLPASKLTTPFLATYFKVEIPKGQELEIYAHIRNNFPYALFLPISILDVENFWKGPYSRQDKVMYFFFGAVIIMILYNLLLFITAHDKTYLLYVIYMFVIFITNFIDTRLYLKIFPGLGEFPILIYWTTVILGQTIGITYITFARKFVNLRKYSKAYDNFLIWWFRLRILSIPIIVYMALGPPAINIAHFAVVTDIFIGILNVIMVYRSKHKIGRYFVWGGSALVVGASLTVFELYNVFPFGERTYGVPLQVGILSELILFSVGLGIRVKMNVEEKRKTESQLLNQLLENEKLQTQVKLELENKVKERTEEIQRRNQEIMKQNVLLVGQKEELEVQAEAVKKANEEVNVKNEALKISFEKLKIAQAELVQSEKMASLGQLTAGIAHEINNPINFVSANIHPLKNDFSEIKNLFERYKKLYHAKEIEKELKDIRAYESKIEADYLFEEIALLLNGIEEGAFRTREIVLGLRNFSRMEENNFKPASINAGLDSTLMLIQGKIKNRINVIKNYDPSLPLVECFPGKINQVFMNVLTNAVQAIHEKGEIILTTRLEGNVVKICIKDTGQGMSPEVKDKIFEPFFTTKEIGKGTGLGLSISYGIIEDHHGKIEVNSKPGIGSEFVITIPVVQPLE